MILKIQSASSALNNDNYIIFFLIHYRMDNKIILEKSNRKNKKFKVTLPDNKTVHFGDDRY